MSLNILNHCHYQTGYDSSLLRGKDDPSTPRPWDLWQLIQSHGNKNSILLDIGCGSAFKLIPLARYFKAIIAVEPSDEMRALAKKSFATTISIISPSRQESLQTCLFLIIVLILLPSCLPVGMPARYIAY